MSPYFCANNPEAKNLSLPGMSKTAGTLFTSRQSPCAYLTVMVTVAELGNVSVPPGPKLTVPMTLNTALDVPSAGVTF